MTRRLLNLLTALSLLFCVALAAATVRSFWIQDRFRWMHSDFHGRTWTMSDADLWVNRGHVVVAWSRRELTYHSDDALSEMLSHHTDRPGRLWRKWHGHESTPAAPPAARSGTVWGRLGFVGRRDRSVSPSSKPRPGQEPVRSGVYEETEYAAPLWPAALLLALHPALWSVRQWRRATVRRRSRAGLCTRCGYDLRASPGTCPECGAQATTPA